MESVITCKNGCCILRYIHYKRIAEEERFRYRKKAGVILYDKYTDKILLVQSKGNLWGPPKGTFENNEKSDECAVRELLEETGIGINSDMLTNKTNICNAKYYFLNMKETEVSVQRSENNDANGIGWIKIKCLEQMTNDFKIRINMHCKKILSHFFAVHTLF